MADMTDVCILCNKRHGANRIHGTSMNIKCWVEWRKLSVEAKIYHARRLFSVYNDVHQHMPEDAAEVTAKVEEVDGEQDLPAEGVTSTDERVPALDLSA